MWFSQIDRAGRKGYLQYTYLLTVRNHLANFLYNPDWITHSDMCFLSKMEMDKSLRVKRLRCLERAVKQFYEFVIPWHWKELYWTFFGAIDLVVWSVESSLDKSMKILELRVFQRWNGTGYWKTFAKTATPICDSPICTSASKAADVSRMM